jgi:hypothetical protein
LKYVSPEARKHITMVCPRSEIKAHKAEDYGKGLSFLGTSDDIHLERKRYKTFEHHQRQGGKYALVLEDDLGLFAWDEEQKKHLSGRDDPSITDKWLLKDAPKLFKEHSMVGAGPYFRHKDAIAQYGMQRYNHKCVCLAGYDVDVLLRLVDKAATRNIWGIDTIHNLYVLTAGYKSVIDYRFLWSTAFDPKDKSGAGSQRKKEDVLDSFLRQMVLFPGLIKRGKQAQHVASFLRVDFMNAPGLDLDPEKRAKFMEKGKKLLAEELKFQGKDKAYLKRLLSDYQ